MSASITSKRSARVAYVYIGACATVIKMKKKCLSQQEPDIEKLEKKLNCGQIEEIVFQVCRHTLSCSVITNKKYRFNIKSRHVEMSNTYW